MDNVYDEVDSLVENDHGESRQSDVPVETANNELDDPEPASRDRVPDEGAKVASRSSSRSSSRSDSDRGRSGVEVNDQKTDRSRSRSGSREGSRTRSQSPKDSLDYESLDLAVSDNSRSGSPSPAAEEPKQRPRSASPEPEARSRSRSPEVSRSRSKSRSPDGRRSRSASSERARSGSGSSSDKESSGTKDQGQNSHVVAKAAEQKGAFKKAGTKAGLEIWRIEQNEPVRQDSKSYGKFYSGDCYIILHTEEYPDHHNHKYDLHFWLGSDCTEEDMLSVFRSVLDLGEALQESVVQYREVQGHETSLFLSYFRDNIRYLIGGLRTSSNQDDGRKKRLFQVKGKKNIRIAQVPCMCGSLNQGDTFVLDDDKHIYVWIGPGSTRKEKLAGLTFARLLRDEEHGKKAHIYVVQDWNDNKQFYKALGSRDKAIKAADTHDDEDIIRKLDQQILIFRIESDSMYEFHERPLVRNMLKSDSMIILDSGPNGIYVWIGKQCDPELKRKVWMLVQDFLNTRGYPYYLPVVRVNEDDETEFFKQYFRSWPSRATDPPTTRDKSDQSAKIEHWLPDDGSGKLKVYRVAQDDLVRIPSRAHGIFFDTESYVLRYRVNCEDELYVIYIWQGSHSTTEERETALKKAMAMDEKYGGTTVQIRVVMNKESAHFLKIFRGRVVYLTSGHINGFISLTDYEGYDPKQAHVFQIKKSTNGVIVIQVPARAASFNSNDTFIVHSKSKRFVWIGKYAPKEEVVVATEILRDTFPGRGDPIAVEEGRESGLFWSVFGGEEPYQTARRRSAQNLHMLPRLFHCTLISGLFTVEELVKFSQDDLVDEDVMLLDTFDEIYMWIGRRTSEFERQQVYRTAYTYLKVDPSGRTADNTLICVVRQGFEPAPFVACFPKWDTDRWHKILKFKKIVKAIESENNEINIYDENDNEVSTFYSYEELKRKVPPEGVDVLKKEMYLSPDDFEAVFHMDKKTFISLPEWKRISLKKRHSLF